MSAREIVNKGSRWLIGTGAKVCVWQNNLIPGIASFRPLSNNISMDRDALVCDLIDQDLGCWNRELVLSSFNAHDVHILSIPLSTRKPNDEIVWHAEKTGCYSVKTAYRRLQTHMLLRNPGPSSLSSNCLWKLLWHSNLHPRVKNFIWRLGKNILPIRVNLQLERYFSRHRLPCLWYVP